MLYYIHAGNHIIIWCNIYIQVSSEVQNASWFILTAASTKAAIGPTVLKLR